MYKTSIVMISSESQHEYMKASIDSIRRYTKRGTYELVIVDSSGSENTRLWLADQTDIQSLFFDEEVKEVKALNQAIRVATGDSILLLHSDTLVTDNWLELLQQALYKEENIGAVGPLTNHADDDQAESTQFSSIEELMHFAKEIGKNELMEKRLNLSDFCFMFKRSLFSSIGDFDEKLSGPALIKDYCLRIYSASKDLILCRHVFVHHYGIDEPIADVGQRFLDKWEQDASAASINSNLLNLITRSSEEHFKVLMIEPGFGATMLKLQQTYPNVDLYYYFHDQFSNSTLMNYKSISIPEKSSFDYILIGSTSNIHKYLPLSLKCLADDGELLVEFENMNHYGIVQRLLLGQGWNGKKTYWRLNDIPQLFEEAGFAQIDFEYAFDSGSEASNNFIAKLSELVEELPGEFEISSFLVRARKLTIDQLLHPLFKDILQVADALNLQKINRYSTDQILNSINTYEGPKVPLLNYIAVSNFENNLIDKVLPYLEAALKIGPADPSTRLNLASVYYASGDDESALYWLENINEKTEKIHSWIESIKKNLYQKEYAQYRVKFLLRRIEFDVQRDEASEELIELFKQGTITAPDVISSVLSDIIDKCGILNRVAVSLFNGKHYEQVIPLLERSYVLDSSDSHTLFNLGYVLSEFGALTEAEGFLKKISNPDEEVLYLLRKIKERA